MNTSLFELFKIGIGPSSSHTVGPMRAALGFIRELAARNDFGAAITVDLYGSLALTGIGHATDRAILMGLLEQSPDTVDLTTIDARLDDLRNTKTLHLLNTHTVHFDPATDLHFHRNQMYPDPAAPTHPNGMSFHSLDAQGNTLYSQTFYSIGGGFILSAEEFANTGSASTRTVPYPFSSAAELLRLGEEHHLSIADIILANEVALLSDPSITRRIDRIHTFGEAKDRVPHLRDGLIVAKVGEAAQTLTPKQQIHAAILTLWQTMSDCIDRGIATEGTLPGGLNVRRRAAGLSRRLEQRDADGKVP